MYNPEDIHFDRCVHMVIKMFPGEWSIWMEEELDVTWSSKGPKFTFDKVNVCCLRPYRKYQILCSMYYYTFKTYSKLGHQCRKKRQATHFSIMTKSGR